MPRDKSYYTSERFIHDDLAARAAGLAEKMLDEWRQTRRVSSMAVSWPGETIKSDEGKDITHAVLMPIPITFSEGDTSAALKRLVSRTKAYGLALTERHGDVLRVLFETHHGARAWLTPLERHGDILVPGKTVVHDDAECLGLLWQARRGTD